MPHAKTMRNLCTGRCRGRGAQAFKPSGLVPGLVRCQFCPLIQQASFGGASMKLVPTGCPQEPTQDKTPQPITSLCTIGYERRSVAQLLADLRQVEIQVVVDVRWTAFSQVAAFRQEVLRRAVLAAGLNYLHLASLGSPPALRQQLEQQGNYSAFFGAYRQYLAESAQAQRTLEQLADLAHERRICLLCRERDHHRCHRSVVAEVLAAQTGLLVEHL